MWEDYVDRSTACAPKCSRSAGRCSELPDLRRYRLVLIDESHNLRNREGKRYRAIQEYIQENESKCILLSATPYNKTYLDLSAQLRLFVAGGSRPGHPSGTLLREIGETEFIRRHQCARALAGRVREERVRRRLARTDAALHGAAHAQLHPGQLRRDRRRDTAAQYLTFEDGTRSYFPTRVPRTRASSRSTTGSRRPVRAALFGRLSSTRSTRSTCPATASAITSALARTSRRRRPRRELIQTCRAPASG